ncbi:MAG: Ubiquinone/menaquinone biosynthesis C-methyltransferase UbiE [Planctomycetota bacterium]
MRHLASLLPVFLLVACAAAPAEQSVRPGIDEDYTDPALDVDRMVARFEAESREIFARRTAIARAVGLAPGMAVADVGAGTGVFTDFFAKDVGPQGRVYAVELSPKFVTLLRERAAARGLAHVTAVQCTERSTELAPGSVDVVFLCDTYHHFEYPRATMGSIHRALRPGGRLVVVDFERIPGVSRQWTLDHVRIGKQEVVAELQSFGFRLLEELDVGLEENYYLRFERVEG